MANETTITTIGDTSYAEYIVPIMHAAAKDFAVAAQFCYEVDATGQATGVVSFPRAVSDSGTPSDYDGPGETTDATALQFDTTQQSVTPTEFVCFRDITMKALEDGFMQGGLQDYLAMSAMEDLAICFDSDVCAVFASASTSVGSSGINLALSDMILAMSQTRKNLARAPSGTVYVLDDQAAEDYTVALGSSSSTTINGWFSRTPDNGLNNGLIGTFLNQEVWSTGLTPTANAGADVVSIHMVRGDTPQGAMQCPIGTAIKRRPLLQVDTDVKGRATLLVVSMRAGAGEIFDAGYTKLVTDA